MQVWILYTPIKHQTRSIKTVIVIAETEAGARNVAQHRTRIAAEDWQVDKSFPTKDAAFVHEYLS